MDHKAHARALIESGLTPRDVIAELHRQHCQFAFEREHAKDHPLAAHRMSPEEWGAFRSHLLDGEGVEDDGVPLDDGRSLRARFVQSLDDNDQAEFWRLFPHVYKSLFLRSGVARALPGGGVSRGPHGSALLDAMQPPRAK